MLSGAHWMWVCLLALLLVGAGCDTQIDQIDDDDDFTRLYKMIKPQPGESPWREIDWVTNITEARRRAAAEDKPLVIFTAADGSPLGRT